MSRKGVLVGLVCCLPGLLLLTGCFDVEESLKLNKDLSGRAGFSMKVDLEPMVGMMTRMQRAMAGKEGEPTAEEMEQAKKDFLASRKTETPDPKAQRAEIEKSLPPGVKLLDSSFDDKGLQILARVALSFDDVAKLSQIALKGPRKKDAPDAPPGPGQKNPFEEPFADLKIVQQGDTLLLTSRSTNPLADQKKNGPDAQIPPEMQKQMEDAFKGMHIVYRIEAPFQVVESNATRREGNTLIWDWSYQTLKDMTPEQEAQGIRVKYRR